MTSAATPKSAGLSSRARMSATISRERLAEPLGRRASRPSRRRRRARRREVAAAAAAEAGAAASRAAAGDAGGASSAVLTPAPRTRCGRSSTTPERGQQERQHRHLHEVEGVEGQHPERVGGQRRGQRGQQPPVVGVVAAGQAPEPADRGGEEPQERDDADDAELEQRREPLVVGDRRVELRVLEVVDARAGALAEHRRPRPLLQGGVPLADAPAPVVDPPHRLGARLLRDDAAAGQERVLDRPDRPGQREVHDEQERQEPREHAARRGAA